MCVCWCQTRSGEGECLCLTVCAFICHHTGENERVPLPSVRMMMVSDDCLVECKIDDDSDEDVGVGGEQINTPPPPPEFASKAPTPAPKPPTPPTAPAMPSPTCPVNRDPYGINQHLKVLFPLSSLDELSDMSWYCVWKSQRGRSLSLAKLKMKLFTTSVICHW